MTTTISKTNERSPSTRTIRTRAAGHLGGGRDGIWPGAIAHDLEGAIEERSSPGAAFLAGAKAIVPVLFALLPFGLAFGATATGNGLSALAALGMSVFVFASAAQLAAVPLLSAGASVAIVVLTVLIVNLRLTLYSASLAPHFGRLPAGWKGLLAYLLTDQVYVNGAVEVSLRNERLLAGLAAALIAWRTRSVPLTLIGGMAMLWMLQAIGLSP